MNKTYKYTLTAHEKKEISFDTGVARLAIANGDGVDGSTTVVMSEITKQHSGELVSFIDGANAPFADFTVNIVADQSGSGDPSPTNVRPITGWTGANVYVSGEDTSNPTTYNIDWQSTVGTVYGGTLDVLTGKLTVTHKAIQLTSSMTWSTSSGLGRTRIFTAISGMKADSTDVYSEVFKGAETLMSIPYAWQACTNGTPAIIIGVPFDYTLQDWKDLLDNETIHLVYPLATPETYQLTPTEIRSLLGVNNVWADCGPVDVRYFVQSTQPMIDYIDDKTTVFFDAQEDLSTYDISLIGTTSTDVKNCLLANKNANIIIRVKRYSTIMLYYLREYSPNYFADFASHAAIFDAEGTKSMRIDYLRLDLTQETADFTNDYIILPTT